MCNASTILFSLFLALMSLFFDSEMLCDMDQTMVKIYLFFKCNISGRCCLDKKPIIYLQDKSL